MKKYWTGVGSRECPKDILTIMQNIGYVLTKKGYILRSGCADGADLNFEIGALTYKVRGKKANARYLLALGWF